MFVCRRQGGSAGFPFRRFERNGRTLPAGFRFDASSGMGAPCLQVPALRVICQAGLCPIIVALEMALVALMTVGTKILACAVIRDH